MNWLRVAVPLLLAFYLFTGTITTELANEQLFLSLTEQQHHEKVLAIKAFITGNDESADVSFLNSRELRHLEDVRQIVSRIQFLFFASFFAFLVTFFFYAKRYAIRDVLKHTFFTVIGVTLVAVAGLLNFTLAFNSLHVFLFEHNTWIFPSQSTFIVLFPLSFFSSFFQHLLVLFLLEAFLLGLLWLLFPYMQNLVKSIKKYLSATIKRHK